MTRPEEIAWWIGLIGSIASIGAAIWAFVEARKARSSASDAEKIRNELVSRRNLVEVADIYKEANRVISALTAVGPSASVNSVRGLDCARISTQALEFVTLLSTHREQLPTSLKSKVELLVFDTKKDLASLAEAKDFESKKAAGSAIYYKITALMPAIKVLADEKRESA